MDMSEQDLQHVADLLEQHMHANMKARHEVKRSHWKRRTVLVVIVLVGGVATHKALQIPGLAEAAQSFELLLTCVVDSLFNRVKEY